MTDTDHDWPFVFELSPDLPIPLSIEHRDDGRMVVILRDGAVVNGGLVQALNDLTRPPEDDHDLTGES